MSTRLVKIQHGRATVTAHTSTTIVIIHAISFLFVTVLTDMFPLIWMSTVQIHYRSHKMSIRCMIHKIVTTFGAVCYNVHNQGI